MQCRNVILVYNRLGPKLKLPGPYGTIQVFCFPPEYLPYLIPFFLMLFF